MAARRPSPQRETKARQRQVGTDSPAPVKALAGSESVLYLYGVTRANASVPGKISLPGASADAGPESRISAVRCEDFLCWTSAVGRAEFVDRLDSNMQDLEWLANASVRHQAVLSELGKLGAVLPARFGLVFSSEAALMRHVLSRRRELVGQFRRIEGADEWGIKIFRLNAGPELIGTAKSGADYLRKKAKAMRVELARGARGKPLPDEIRDFAAELKKLARDVAPGGSVSRGQPGLEWQLSILLPKRQQARFSSLIEHSARAWIGVHRIEVTGPWPPYSFVKEEE